MNISNIIGGSVLICIGIFIVLFQIKEFKNGVKDRWGYGKGLLISGITFIFGGIVMIVKVSK
jgi:hypothetical protein